MGDMADLYSDSWWGEDEYTRDEYEPTLVSCRYCKCNGFCWRETEVGLRLVTPTGQIHSGEAYAKQRRTSNDSKPTSSMG